MRVRAVRVSGELWQEICTQGWKAADDIGIVECVEGLPEGAKFVGLHYERWNGKDIVPTLVFLFEHPDFDNVPEGKKIPDIDIIFEKRPINEDLFL